MDEEKKYFRHQAEVWGLDEKLYGDIQNKKKQNQIESIQKYKSDLDEQIKLKKQLLNDRNG
jgi:hypothetical protein